MGTPLSEQEMQAAMQKLPEWRRNEQAIERRYEFANFADAMVFVNKIAEAAEEANHHPDIAISYNKVTLQLTSHDSGGVTQRDVKMAARINEIAQR